MADILIQPAVPSLFTHTESASSLIVDSANVDSSTNSATHYNHSSTTNNSTNNINNNNPNTANKYVGHVSRLRSVFTQYALTINDLKPADGADESSLSPPTSTLPLVTTSSSTIIERSRSLSNPRLLENNSSTMSTMRNGMSSLTMADNHPSSSLSSGQILINNHTSNDDHTVRFRKAKEMFQTLEEEATRTSLVPTTTTKSSKSPYEQSNHETYQPDLMHDEQKTLTPKINSEHIPDLIIDHHQQQQTIDHSPRTNDSSRLREIPVQFLGTSASSSPTHSDRSFTSIPVHRTPPPLPPPVASQPPLISDEVPYAMINRKHVTNDQHYDFPADAIEQMKKQQRDDNETNHHVSKPSNEEIADRIVASILPSNILKRMDHLNTVFIKPTAIDRSIPKLSFQEDEIPQSESTNDSHQHVEIKSDEKEDKINEDEPKWIENPMANDQDVQQETSRSSSPVFYEKPGLPEFKDDNQEELTLSPNGTRRVKFSNAPIRVYPTYSPSEYNRRNDDIDPFSASAEYELEKRIEKMNVFSVEIEKGPDGLGISVLGMGVGADSGLEKLGIFVKSLNPQGVIAQDGRIQIGDQIVEVDGQSLVGVTHTYATNILKATSGLVRFVIGREKDVENSEIIRLIQQSLQMDQERNEMSRALQHHHDAFNQQHFNDDGFDNLELNEEPKFHEELAKAHEKNYEQIWSMNENNQIKDDAVNSYEFEMLKQRYETLEKTLTNTEKEKDYYQKLYEQTKQEFEHIEEKYLKAKKLIKELQDRENDLREQQAEKNDQQQKRVFELTKKIEELEKTIALSATSSINNHQTKVSNNENTSIRPPDIPERIPMRSRTSSGQHLLSPERPPSRNTPVTSSVRLPSTSTEKVSNTKPSNQSDFEVDRSPLLNHSIQMDKSQIAKTRQRQLPTKRSSNTLIDDGINQQNDEVDIRISKEQISKPSANVVTDEFVEVKDWTSDQCIQWLTAKEMTSFIPMFLNRNIDGEKLLLLDSTKMKAMGIKSSKDRDYLKTKLKELKHAELDRIRERLLAQQPLPSTSQTIFQHSVHSGNRLRSSSMTKLKERRLFGGSGGK